MPQRPQTADFSGSRDRAEEFEAGELDLAQERYAHALDDDRRGSKVIVGVIAGGFVVIMLGVMGLRALSSDPADDPAPASSAVDPREAGRFDAPPPPEAEPSPEAAPDDEASVAEPTTPEPATRAAPIDTHADTVAVPARSAVEPRPADGRPPAAEPSRGGDDRSAASDDPAPFANLPKPDAPEHPPAAEPSEPTPDDEAPAPEPAPDEATDADPSDPSPSSDAAPAASAAVELDDAARGLLDAPAPPTEDDDPAPRPVSVVPM